MALTNYILPRSQNLTTLYFVMAIGCPQMAIGFWPLAVGSKSADNKSVKIS